jgi:hypothetical protein
MVFNTTFNNISAISWQSVLLVEETGLCCGKIIFLRERERERELKKNGKILITTIVLVRTDMNVNEHKRLSNITLRHKLK